MYKYKVHSFVSSFLAEYLKIEKELFSKQEILEDILSYLKIFSYLSKANKLSFPIQCELKFFFDECKFIAKKRGKDITVPEVMKYTDIVKYIDYFFVIDTDFEAELIYQKEYQKRFSDTIFDELQSVVYSPDRIKSWIHLEPEVNLKPYSDCSKFI